MLLVFLSPCVGYCVVPHFERDMSWAGSAHVNDSCTENVVMLVKLIRYVFWSRLTACLCVCLVTMTTHSSITNWFCQWPSDKLSTYYNLSMHNRQNDKQRETECRLCSRAAGILHVVSYMCSKSWGWCTVTVVHCTVTVFLRHSDCIVLHSDCAVLHSDCIMMHSYCDALHIDCAVIQWLWCIVQWLCCDAPDSGALHSDYIMMHSDCGALYSDCVVMHLTVVRCTVTVFLMHNDCVVLNSDSVVARWLLCCTVTVLYYTVTVWLCCVAVVQMGEEYCHAGDYTKALA